MVFFRIHRWSFILTVFDFPGWHHSHFPYQWTLCWQSTKLFFQPRCLPRYLTPPNALCTCLSVYSRTTLGSTGSLNTFHYLPKPPPCSVNGSITLPNSKHKNYAWYFPLPMPHKQLVTKSCWVKLQKVSGFCQMIFPCTAPDASDPCFYCYMLSSSPCQQFIHLQYFPMTIQNDLSKCRADQAISHWIPTAAYIKYQLFSMALHSLALTISVALSLTTFAL